MFYKMMSLPMI